ncbi:MAG: hypothetical protein HY821_09175 [Acidobacteria bacterium]|nr:hypothetical protein [Acidobacteriota bacterium]
MNRKMFHLLVAAALTAALSLAQGPKGPGANPDAPRTGSGPALGTIVAVSGAITAIQSTAGVQYPTIVVDGKQIRIAPVWFMLENDFELAVGDKVDVKAAACTCADGSLYALEIVKGSAVLQLRDAQGLPLWITRGHGQSGGNPSAPRTGTGCVDSATIKTITGTVESVTMGVGIQQPALVVKTSEGVVAVKIGPERVLFDNDIELKPGDAVTVRYGLATCSEENVALSLTVGGVTVILREDDGRAAWNH